MRLLKLTEGVRNDGLQNWLVNLLCISTQTISIIVLYRLEPSSCIESSWVEKAHFHSPLSPCTLVLIHETGL